MDIYENFRVENLTTYLVFDGLFDNYSIQHPYMWSYSFGEAYGFALRRGYKVVAYKGGRYFELHKELLRV
jgi:hypothetical protein